MKVSIIEKIDEVQLTEELGLDMKEHKTVIYWLQIWLILGFKLCLSLTRTSACLRFIIDEPPIFTHLSLSKIDHSYHPSIPCTRSIISYIFWP